MKTAIVILCLITVTSANAALYKCKSRTTGALYFRDTPCLVGDIQLSVTGTTTPTITVTDWGNTTAPLPTTQTSSTVVATVPVAPVPVTPTVTPSIEPTTLSSSQNPDNLVPVNPVPTPKPYAGIVSRGSTPPGRYMWREILSR